MESKESAIWPPFEAFYIQSMLFNSVSATQSIARLENIFSTLPIQVTQEDITKLPVKSVLNELQNIVLQSASLSRYFWPIRKGHEARGKRLRDSFSMTEPAHCSTGIFVML